MTSDRKFASGRYFKRAGLNLDHDGSKYLNTYSIFDGEKDTGISVSDSGDSAIANSNKRTVVLRGQQYPTLGDALAAYEGCNHDQTLFNFRPAIRQ